MLEGAKTAVGQIIINLISAAICVVVGYGASRLGLSTAQSIWVGIGFGIVFCLGYLGWRVPRELAKLVRAGSGAATGKGVSVFFRDGELVKSNDETAMHVFMIHEGKRHWINSWPLLHKISPGKGEESVSWLSPHVLDLIPIGRDVTSETEAVEVFGSRK